jgi:NAD(P)-dependent dehydrogenase (short-subunit alcohol dehydrogenase family)
MPSVLVTGAGRGIGRTVALHMAQRGWEVYAGVRRPEDGEALRQTEAGITPVLLDITDAVQVAQLPSAVASHSRFFWGFRLHALFAMDGTPRALALTSPKDVVTGEDHHRPPRRPGQRG